MTTAKAEVSSVHSPAPISHQKLAANRRNARRSTGPRTDEGKRASSRNAVSHAIFCRELLVAGESAEELSELRDGVRDALAPRDAIEHGFVDSVVAARWQLRRLRAAERHVYVDVAADAHLGVWGQHPITIERTLALDLGQPRSTWERLSRYEQRLEQNVARSMRELRAYRKDLREFGRPEPVDVDDGDGDEKAQNEPTAEEMAASDDAAEGCVASSRGTGASPVQSEQNESTGEAPVPREEDENRASDG